MTTHNKGLALLVATTISLMLCAPALAQSIADGATAFDNLDLALGRPPGNMVGAGVGRAMQAADAGHAQVVAPQITETSRPTSIRAQFLVSAIDTIFQELNRILLFFGSRLFARAGLPPLLSMDALFPPTESTGGDLTNLDGTELGDILDEITGGSGSNNDGSGGTDTNSTGSEPTDSDTTDSNGGRRPSRGGRG
jgi:hypothetical protein